MKAKAMGGFQAPMAFFVAVFRNQAEFKKGYGD